MRDNWKLWLTGAIALIVLGFAIHRFHSSFSDRPPDWMQLQEVTSPRLPAELTAQYSAFHTELENEAKSTGLPIQSLQLVEIMSGNKELRTWRLEQLANPGPGALSSFEVNRWLTENTQVGYYTLDGAPLDFRLRHHPTNPKTVFATVLFDQPVTPSVSLWVLAIDHQPFNLKRNAAGEYVYQFPWLRSSTTAIQAAGVILPEEDSLVQYNPTTGVYTSTKSPTLIAWISTRMDPGATPPTVTFKPQ